jgi:hypothetical protein
MSAIIPVKLTYGAETFFHTLCRSEIWVELLGSEAFRSVGAKYW